MFFYVLSYFLTIFVVFMIIYKHKHSIKPLPKLKLNKNGLVFCSQKNHKIFVGSAKFVQIENRVYVKNQTKTILIKNVCEVYLRDGFLCFKAMGKVELFFNCKNYYKFFNINITLDGFNFAELKQHALHQLANNLFNVNACSVVKRYIHAVRFIFNINLANGKVEIKQNIYRLHFLLSYKVNNTLKRVMLN